MGNNKSAEETLNEGGEQSEGINYFLFTFCL